MPVFLLLMFGCPVVGDDEVEELMDRDGDGWDSPQYGGEDCDDEDATIHPGAQEICGDGIDNNCDGGAEGCGVLEDKFLAEAESSVELASPGIGSFEASIWTGDIDNDGQTDIFVGSGAVAGAFVAMGPIVGADEPDFYHSIGNKQSGCGDAVSVADFGGDGQLDFAVGAPMYKDETGMVVIFAGPLTAHSTPTVELVGDKGDWTATGHSLAAVDFDDDGQAELAVGSPGSMGVYLFVNPQGDLSLDDADAFLQSEETDFAGQELWAADIDSDGVEDLIVGAPWRETTKVNAGVFYVAYGGEVVDLSLADGPVIGGSRKACTMGHTLWAGDLDGDGHNEVVASANGEGASCEIATVWVASPGTKAEEVLVDDVAIAKIEKDNTGSVAFGGALSGGDLNGDSFIDLVVGDPEDNIDTGNTSIYLGPLSGTLTESHAIAIIRGDLPFDRVGSALAVDDIDHDGVVDLVVVTAGGAGAFVFPGTLGL
ncbi:MAG: hypothetical protein HN348_10810 [Proteobacteria bacterium]|nr:hypothetical protein [Pseudomonadota bacterium]